MLGVIIPESGTIEILGGNPGANKTKIGYMPQYAKFDSKFPLKVLDLVLMGIVERKKIGLHSRKDKEAAIAALARVKIDETIYRRNFASLSGGELQRVLMARAIISHPELLILDEPTSNIDPVGGEMFAAILEDLNKDMAIVTVSHDLGFVNRLFREVLCVNRVVIKHPTRNLSSDSLSEIYGKSIHVIDHTKHSCTFD